MEISKIIQRFESHDVHEILDGVWAVLDCTDVNSLRNLLPFVKKWRARIREINLGGAFYRNSNHFDMAMTYIEEMCNGGCHCSIYKSTSLFNPEYHEKKQFVKVVHTAVDVEKYETYFDVDCKLCSKKFKVTEFLGGHVAWYQWRVA